MRLLQIAGFPKYGITDSGWVINLSTGKILKPYHSTLGYSSVKLISEGGGRYTKDIHRLVALAFIPEVEGKPLVDHINRNKHDNYMGNLRWVDRRENAINSHVSERRRGSHYDKARGKWYSCIVINNKTYNLGRRTTEEAAQKLYFEMYLEWYGVKPW